MTDNTQELVEQLANWFDNMGSENPFWSRAHSAKMGELIMPIITTYTNKQIEAVLDRLNDELEDLPYISYKGGYQIPYEEIEALIQAERAKLKEVK